MKNIICNNHHNTKEINTMKKLLFGLIIIAYTTHAIAAEPKNEYIETGIKFFFAGVKATVNTVKNAKNAVSNKIENFFNNVSDQQSNSLDPYTETEIIIPSNNDGDSKKSHSVDSENDKPEEKVISNISDKEISNDSNSDKTNNDEQDIEKESANVQQQSNKQSTSSMYKYAPQAIGITAIIAATIYYYKKPIVNGILKIKRKIINYFS